MWHNRKQFIIGILVFLGTVTCLMMTSDLRMIGVTSQSKEDVRPVKHDHGCFSLSKTFHNVDHREQTRLERGCTKRKPDALIIGTKKCGTSTLKDFIAFHPQIAAADFEAHYYDNKRFMGFDWFLEQMPYALPNQLIVEKTPRYFVYPGVQERIRKELASNVKLIVIFRDPVVRAVSDYTHIIFKRYMTEKQKRSLDSDVLKPTLTPKQAEMRRKVKAEEAVFFRKYPNYDNIGDTFEESVLTDSGEIDTSSAIIDTGIYVKYVRKWLQYFPSKQFLFLDGDLLISDPVKVVAQVEEFLGVDPYFTPEHFLFSAEKGFFCLSQPMYACMKSAKGRPHLPVSDSTIEKLKRFYEPYNVELVKLLNQTFSFT
ncbi:heparan sulfate glucosamine 3-O-sulfotransferase 1-like [Diadema setosum]|uniref:heparan sulfate glucosamine 3-O-sulfotransferase 1-like n=1 Tax=Diadema setosum TaxID=31175 RepID=UPI003B3B54A2